MNNINVRLCTMQSNDSLIHDACAKCKGDVGRKKYCKSCGLEDKDRDAKGTKWLKPLQILKAFSISKTEKKVQTNVLIAILLNLELDRSFS